MKFICFALFFCFVISSTFAIKVKLPQDQCSQCEAIIGFIEGWIENNATDSEIEAYLDTLCEFVPGIQTLCDQIAQWGVQYVVNYIKTNENPQTLCTQFGLCSSSSSLLLSSQIIPADSTTCMGCITIVGAIEAFLASSATESEIEAALDTLCDLIPSLQTPCDAIVAELPQVIAYIEQNDNSTVVCQLLGLCPTKQKQQQQQKPVVVTTQPKITSGECGPCEDLLTAMELWLAANKTEVVIENDLLKYICPFVPSFATVCAQIFKNGVPTVITWLEQSENPTVVCTQLGLCPNTKLQIISNLKGSSVVVN